MIHLPFPPTANNLFKNVAHGRARTQRYDAWLLEAWAMVMQQRPDKISGPYRMTLVATRPDRRRRDIANLEKPVSDLLVKAGVIRDDSDAESIHLMWSGGKPDKTGGVRVRLEAI